MTVRDMVTTLQALPRDAMAFFGGLGDLLATAAMGDWTAADEAHIAYGLSSWHPTAGTRAASKVSRQRRNGRRVRYTNGHLEYRDDDPPTLQWTFPAPMGTRAIVGEFSMADVVTIPSHLSIPEVRTCMTVEAARDVSAPDTPAPAAVDERGPSSRPSWSTSSCEPAANDAPRQAARISTRSARRSP